MIFTGNKRSDKLRIVTVTGRFASAMSFSFLPLQSFIREMQEEAILNNQIIFLDNHKFRTTEMNERFSQIIGE